LSECLELTTGLSVSLSQLNVTKLKLKYLKIWFKCKSERKRNKQKFYCITKVRLF